GFDWDEHRQLVVAEDAVWNSYLNSHKEAGQLRHHSFPYYDQLTVIYARDRATEKDAQTAADVIKKINVQDLRNRNQIETKGVPHLQRRKKKNSDANDHISSSFHDAATLLAKNMHAIGEQSVGVLPPMW
ncbi:hypothetical protein Gotur_020030, partial [Gossypium turneri]